jgi:hypothetical protein
VIADPDSLTIDERLLAAAKTDNEELLETAFEDPSLDVNYQDGLGNTGTLLSLIVSISANLFAVGSSALCVSTAPVHHVIYSVLKGFRGTV